MFIGFIMQILKFKVLSKIDFFGPRGGKKITVLSLENLKVGIGNNLASVIKLF